jgi:hypothetical protein
VAIIDADAVRSHLIGVAAQLDALVGDGDSPYLEAANAAQAEFERATRILVEPRTIRMNPDGTEAYDVEEDPLTLRKMNSARPPRWQLRRRPVIELLSCRFEFSSANRVLSWNPSNLRVNKHLGIVTLVPFTNLTVGAAGASVYWAVMGTGTWPGDVIPQFVCIDYRAGYTDAATNPDLADLRRALANRAALEVLQRAIRVLPNSDSLDGFSQQFTSVERQVELMGQEWAAFLSAYQRRERPLVAGVL